MPNAFTLTRGDEETLRLIPWLWSQEHIVVADIAFETNRTSGDTLRRIARFVRNGLVERRQPAAACARAEIRRLPQ